MMRSSGFGLARGFAWQRLCAVLALGAGLQACSSVGAAEIAISGPPVVLFN
jgi:hypothetical protein